MTGRMAIQKTLFLDEKDYNTFADFISLIIDLASNFDDEDIDKLQASIEQFAAKVYIEEEEED